MNLWQNYKKVLFNTFDLQSPDTELYWEGKRDTTLRAKEWQHKYFLKAREVEIYNENSCIYNNILYPKTGSNLPCFGMDLMGFNENRVIIVFDFQHPKENYPYSVEGLPVATEDYRFFEKGNHFSDNIFVRYCKMEEVNAYLSTFKEYLTKFKDMVEYEKPTGLDTSVYKDFDAYMTRLDPVSGFLKGKFGKEKAESLVNDFLFEYG